MLESGSPFSLDPIVWALSMVELFDSQPSSLPMGQATQDLSPTDEATWTTCPLRSFKVNSNVVIESGR